MTKEDTKDLIQRMYDAFNTRNIAAADEIFAPDFYSHSLKTGVEGVKKSWTSMLQAFPDAQAIVEEMLVDGDKVASRTRIHGVPALADGTQPMILEMIRVKDQRIAELWGLTNLYASTPNLRNHGSMTSLKPADRPNEADSLSAVFPWKHIGEALKRV